MVAVIMGLNSMKLVQLGQCPKETTSDNKEVRIQSGRKIPYQTISTDGTNVEFIDTELSLRVLPNVTFDKKFIWSLMQPKMPLT